MTVRDVFTAHTSRAAKDAAFVACALILIFGKTIISAFADEDPALKLYLLMENDARALFQKYNEGAVVEADRKKRAGEPPLTEEDRSFGSYAAKEFIYNKVLFHPLCLDQAGGNKAHENLTRPVMECVNKKQDELFEASQLEKYAPMVGERKYFACQVKARDFRSERRFPPFEFLRDNRDLRVIDYGKANECVKSLL
jgi:hypothetical protein